MFEIILGTRNIRRQMWGFRRQCVGVQIKITNFEYHRQKQKEKLFLIRKMSKWKKQEKENIDRFYFNA